MADRGRLESMTRRRWEVIWDMMKARPGLAIIFALALCGGQASASSVAVGPQYDSTHVYMAPDQLDGFVASVIATFGGHASKPAVVTVTPTPSTTISEVVFTPVGFLSVFGFQTPIPYPFGAERTGYLVSDMDQAVAAARAAGAEVVVAPFPDAIGRDAVIRWPGGVMMQLYWHTVAPTYAPLASVPENRVYVSPDAADAFVRDFVAFSGGRVASDDAAAPGVEIGRARRSLSPHPGGLGVWRADCVGHRRAFALALRAGGDRLCGENSTPPWAKGKAAGVKILAGPCRRWPRGGDGQALCAAISPRSTPTCRTSGGCDPGLAGG